MGDRGLNTNKSSSGDHSDNFVPRDDERTTFESCTNWLVEEQRDQTHDLLPVQIIAGMGAAR